MLFCMFDETPHCQNSWLRFLLTDSSTESESSRPYPTFETASKSARSELSCLSVFREYFLLITYVECLRVNVAVSSRDVKLPSKAGDPVIPTILCKPWQV